MPSLFISLLLTLGSGDRVSLKTEKVKEQDWMTNNRKQPRKCDPWLANTEACAEAYSEGFLEYIASLRMISMDVRVMSMGPLE